MIDKNSMLYWYPRIKDLNIPMPKTVIVPIHVKWDKSGEYLLISNIEHQEIKMQAKQFAFPIFIRGSHISGKHYWKDTCFVEKVGDLRKHVLNIIERSACADFAGLPCECIAIREFIQMDTLFIAFHGTPINVEIRFFMKDKDVLCHHWYWVPEVFEKYTEDMNYFASLKNETFEFVDFKTIIKESQDSIAKEEIELLTKHAMKIGKALMGAWSVDFCRGNNKTWYFIDCALLEDSWHPDDCHGIDLVMDECIDIREKELRKMIDDEMGEKI